METEKALEPLMYQLRRYDELRLKLERYGGRTDDLKAISAALTEQFNIRGSFRVHKIMLIDHESIDSMLFDIGDFDLHFDVKQLYTGMPVYYLCRTRRDYWAEYSLIVHDFYRSPGYPMDDERFVKLMRRGHEVYHLRLSLFRDAVVQGLIKKKGSLNCKQVDRVLYNIGRHVFQAAWHEDQRLAVQVSIHFDLENFRHCIELLYLCLTAELCELRTSIDESMLQFFDLIYPQPAIHSFLKKTLMDIDGGALNEIQQKALVLYERLSDAFSNFLGVEVSWGCHNIRIPLYKIIYGNFSRLDIVGKKLSGNIDINKQIENLETESQSIINGIIMVQ